MTPEEKARPQIDAQPGASGWAIQTKDRINVLSSRGTAGQMPIAADVERRLSVVEELESEVSADLHWASRLRQSILQKA